MGFNCDEKNAEKRDLAHKTKVMLRVSMSVNEKNVERHEEVRVQLALLFLSSTPVAMLSWLPNRVAHSNARYLEQDNRPSNGNYD